MSHVLILTAAEPLPRRLAEDALRAGGAADDAILWRADDAAEAAIARPGADALGAARSVLGEARIDLNLVPATGRRKAVLVADMDSTIIGCECIDEIADMAGLKPEIAAITERAMAGELDFEAALEARVAKLAGLPEAALDRAWHERVRLNPGAETLVRSMAAAGALTALVSGGFTYFTERVAHAAGFAEHRANRLVFADGRLTGAVDRPILGRAAKEEALTALASRAGIPLGATLAIGDGANDLDMIRAAGLGVGYRPKAALAAEADIILDHSPLSALLAIQGYAPHEILIP